MSTSINSSGITFPDATTQTTAVTSGVTSLNGQTGAITETTFGNIGSYVPAIIYSNSGTLYTFGSTVAGSSLTGFNANSSTQGVSVFAIIQNTVINLGLSGTWRNMGNSKNFSTAGCCVTTWNYVPSLWVRVS
jgi:hypothetical protein